MRTAATLGLGFVGGVLVTIAVTTQTGLRPPGVQIAGDESTAQAHADLAASPASNSSKILVNGAKEFAEEGLSSNYLDSLSSPTIAVAPGGVLGGAEITKAKLETRGSNATTDSNSDAQDDTEQPERTPIPLPAGVELDGAVAEMHDRLERQPEDPSWAAVVEAEIANYLAQKPGLQDFSMPVIECRQTICEIQWISYDPNPYATWLTETEDFFQQPWNVFQGMGVNTFVTAPGVQATVIVLTQDPPGPPAKDGSKTRVVESDSASI